MPTRSGCQAELHTYGLRCSHPCSKAQPHRSQDPSSREEVREPGATQALTVSRLAPLRKGPGPPVVPGEGAKPV